MKHFNVMKGAIRVNSTYFDELALTPLTASKLCLQFEDIVPHKLTLGLFVGVPTAEIIYHSTLSCCGLSSPSFSAFVITNAFLDELKR